MMMSKGSIMFWIMFSVILWSIWKYLIRDRFRSEIDE